MTSASNPELEKSVESCERWEWFGGGLVVVGVIAEVAIAAIHPPYDSFLEQWGSSLANSLVAIGVGLEIKFGQMAGLRQSELKRRSDEEVAAANQEAKQASLALFKFRQPRGKLLTPENREKLLAALSPFAGTRFVVGHDNIDRETWDFLWGLEPLLAKAGWVLENWVGGQVFGKNGWPGNHSYGLANAMNVTVEMKPHDQAVLAPAAEALAAGLREIGIDAKQAPPNNTYLADGAIQLLVGPKR